ncbi:hypothetical protein Esti_006662 [Eimeria stiedai]
MPLPQLLIEQPLLLALLLLLVECLCSYGIFGSADATGVGFLLCAYTTAEAFPVEALGASSLVDRSRLASCESSNSSSSSGNAVAAAAAEGDKGVTEQKRRKQQQQELLLQQQQQQQQRDHWSFSRPSLSLMSFRDPGAAKPCDAPSSTSYAVILPAAEAAATAAAEAAPEAGAFEAAAAALEAATQVAAARPAAAAARPAVKTRSNASTCSELPPTALRFSPAKSRKPGVVRRVSFEAPRAVSATPEVVEAETAAADAAAADAAAADAAAADAAAAAADLAAYRQIHHRRYAERLMREAGEAETTWRFHEQQRALELARRQEQERQERVAMECASRLERERQLFQERFVAALTETGEAAGTLAQGDTYAQMTSGTDLDDGEE